MGTNSTMSKDRTIKMSESLDESTEYDYKYSYRKNKQNTTQSLNQSETTEKTKISELNDTMPYTFEWKEGGNDVKITGSFLENWTRQEKMKFNEEKNLYEITFDLPKGSHQFKFIINGNWLCSKEYKIINDERNNFNNEIDININNENTNGNNISNNQDMKKRKKKLSKGNMDYNCLIPSKSSVNAEAPNIPYHYKSYLNLNINLNQLNDEKFKETKRSIDIDKTKYVLENETFKSITTIPHDKLSHLFLNLNNDNNKYLRCAITQRNKHKFLTLVYLSPKK